MQDGGKGFFKGGFGGGRGSVLPPRPSTDVMSLIRPPGRVIGIPAPKLGAAATVPSGCGAESTGPEAWTPMPAGRIVAPRPGFPVSPLAAAPVGCGSFKGTSKACQGPAEMRFAPAAGSMPAESDAKSPELMRLTGAGAKQLPSTAVPVPTAKVVAPFGAKAFGKGPCPQPPGFGRPVLDGVQPLRPLGDFKGKGVRPLVPPANLPVPPLSACRPHLAATLPMGGCSGCAAGATAPAGLLCGTSIFGLGLRPPPLAACGATPGGLLGGASIFAPNAPPGAGLPLLGSLPPFPPPVQPGSGPLQFPPAVQSGDPRLPAPAPAQRKQVWPVFVGNISFDTTEEEVAVLFRACKGLKSFRLATQTGGGGSRGFGFAEFDEPVAALEAIKAIDGTDIRGRRLRLRWGENAPTTKEVDDFHRAPERFKTRPCFEAFKGSTCPRADDCPYAHTDAELRRLGDRQADGPPSVEPKGPAKGCGLDALHTAGRSPPAAAPPAAPPDSIKVPVPFDSFPGATDEEKQRAAYNAVLGTGASNIRAMMKKTGCRLQLRGMGDRAASAASGTESKEPLHVVVRPGVDEKPVTDEQVEVVRRTIEELVKNGGKPSELADAGPSSSSTTKPATSAAAGSDAPTAAEGGEGGAKVSRGAAGDKAQDALRSGPRRACALGFSCPDLDCNCAHPRLPGFTPAPADNARMQFFVVRSITLANIQTSVKTGVWATSRFNTQMLAEAFEKSDHVVLLFSANQTGHFQGYARMASAPDRDLQPGLWGRMSDRLGHNFKVAWLKQCMLPFSQTDSLRNGLNNDSPLRKSRDGQEVPSDLGEKLARLMYQQRTEDLLALPSDEDDADLFRGASRSRSARGGGASRSGSRQRRPPRRGSRSRSREDRGRRGSQDRDRGRDNNRNGASPGAWVPPVGEVPAAASGAGPPSAEKADEASAPWLRKPASTWTVPGSAAAPAASPAPAPGGYGPPPGWGSPYGPPPGWGYYPPPGPYGLGHPGGGPPGQLGPPPQAGVPPGHYDGGPYGRQGSAPPAGWLGQSGAPLPRQTEPPPGWRPPA